MYTTPLFKLSNFDDVFVDAHVSDNKEQLVFLSVFGNFTLLQQLRARLVLPRNDDLALGSLIVEGIHVNHYSAFDVVPEIESKIAKVPHPRVNSLGHLMLFTPKLVTPDKMNREGYLIQLPNESDTSYSHRLWSLIQALSDVPLLDEWKDSIVQNLRSNQQLKEITGAYGTITTAHEIKITDDFAEQVSALLTTSQLMA